MPKKPNGQRKDETTPIYNYKIERKEKCKDQDHNNTSL